jgi:hypothetical protein
LTQKQATELNDLFLPSLLTLLRGTANNTTDSASLDIAFDAGAETLKNIPTFHFQFSTPNPHLTAFSRPDERAYNCPKRQGLPSRLLFSKDFACGALLTHSFLYLHSPPKPSPTPTSVPSPEPTAKVCTFIH